MSRALASLTAQLGNLRQLTSYLQGFARNQDTVGRYGGEEFTRVLAQAARAADGDVDRLRNGWRAEEPITSLSGGYAVHIYGWAPADTPAALYRAKRDGRDRAARGGSETTAAAGIRT